jgi:phosphoribosylformylglycinamidine synthase
MKKVRALVLSGYGINCEREMAHGAAMAGAEVVSAHAKAWLLGDIKLSDFDLLLFPGGFSFGDELGAGKAFANRIVFSKRSEDLSRFVASGKCILAVCNGFQMLVKMRILPGALIRNERGKFESRWVHQKVLPSRCIFTTNLKSLYLPVRHGEGNFTMPDAEKLLQEKRVVLQYADADGEVAQNYPENPNGSLGSIAGVCDETGRVLGMMPHPEAALFFTQLPDWVRQKEEKKRKGEPIPDYGSGLALFKNAVDYLRQ